MVDDGMGMADEMRMEDVEVLMAWGHTCDVTGRTGGLEGSCRLTHKVRLGR